MNKVWEAKTQNIYLLKNVGQSFFSLWSTVGKTVTKKTSWISPDLIVLVNSLGFKSNHMRLFKVIYEACNDFKTNSSYFKPVENTQFS